VANVLALQDDPLILETRRFVRMFKFFDLLNVRSLKEASHERNPDKEQYRCVNDDRLKVVCTFELFFLLFSMHFKMQWLEGDFLGYLDEWQKYVMLQLGDSRRASHNRFIY